MSPPSGAPNTGVVAFSNSNTTLTLTGNNDLANAGAILVTRRRVETPPRPASGYPGQGGGSGWTAKRGVLPQTADPAPLAGVVNRLYS